MQATESRIQTENAGVGRTTQRAGKNPFTLEARLYILEALTDAVAQVGHPGRLVEAWQGIEHMGEDLDPDQHGLALQERWSRCRHKLMGCGARAMGGLLNLHMDNQIRCDQLAEQQRGLRALILSAMELEGRTHVEASGIVASAQPAEDCFAGLTALDVRRKSVR